MLDGRIVRREAEDISNQVRAVECSGDESALMLDHHHQVSWIGKVIRAPHRALQRLGGKKLVHSRKIADHGDCHAGNLSRDCVTLSRKGQSSVTPMPGPAGTGITPFTVSSFSFTMSRVK
jgi:hypothetical protein